MEAFFVSAVLVPLLHETPNAEAITRVSISVRSKIFWAKAVSYSLEKPVPLTTLNAEKILPFS